MKTVKMLFLIVSVIASSLCTAQNGKDLPYSTIFFTRSGNYFLSGCMSTLVFPNQRGISIGPNSVIKYKIYSDGEVNITLDALCAGNGSAKQYVKQLTINIQRGNEYYVSCEGITIKEAEKSKAEKQIAKCKNVVKYEENLENPINPSSVKDIAKKSGKGQATCFLISPEGYLVTNFHAVENANEIFIKGIDGDFTTKFGVTVVGSDPSNDLVLLKITNKSVKFGNPPFGLRLSGVSQAERVYALGFPIADAMGVEIKVTEGIISAKSGIHGDISKFQISASVNPGNSGGPLIDESGNIIGVIYAKSTIADAAGYAVKASYLDNFLKNIEGFNYPTFINELKDKPLTEKIAAFKQYIFILETN